MEQGNWAGSFTQEMNGNSANMRSLSMLPHIDALPGAQAEASGVNRDGELNRSESRPKVGSHIVVSLSRMNKQWIAIRNEPLKKPLQIAPDIRIRILLNQKGGRSMLNEESRQSGG